MLKKIIQPAIDVLKQTIFLLERTIFIHTTTRLPILVKM